jgi:predicted glycoside hydrolase/deacetylase ChbG (UPF0249 family)
LDRALIVNGDDFGYTHGVNAAIDRCARDGILRSATIMANGAAFDEAVSLARDNGNLRVGVHLVLTELESVSDPADIPGLADEHGLLPETPGRLWSLLLRRKISRETLMRELSLQVTKVLDHGLPVTHLDSHKHVHMLPQVLDAVCAVASKYSIPSIRKPFDESPALGLLRTVERGDRVVFVKQHLKAGVASGFRLGFARSIRGVGLTSPDHFYGISLTGVWNEASAISLIGQIRPGVTEWMMHPGDCDADLRGRHTRLLEQREKERDILMSRSLMGFLDEHHIQLRSYGGNGR